MPRLVTPALLARDTGMNVDDVLLALWDSKIEYPTTPNSRIRSEDIRRAKAACGVDPLKRRLLVSYWIERLDKDQESFIEWASERGVTIGANARRLPKGALARFERAMVEEKKPLAVGEPSPAEEQQMPLETLVWRVVGHVREPIRHLGPDEIQAIHFQIAEDFANTHDPIAPAGVRSAPLLESAAGRSSAGMGNYLKYPTVEMAAAALMHSVVQNHPFFNGNKRTALVSMLAFLDENGLVLSCSQKEIFKWTVRIASHKLGAARYVGDLADNEVQLMAIWLNERSRNVEAGERVVTFAVLRRQLQAFGCEIQTAKGNGNKVVVSRAVEVTQSGLFGTRTKSETRRYYLPYGGDGRQVSRARIKELRRELHLSEEYGTDSASFYGSAKGTVDQFIAQYRKTLKRLAKL